MQGDGSRCSRCTPLVFRRVLELVALSSTYIGGENGAIAVRYLLVVKEKRLLDSALLPSLLGSVDVWTSFHIIGAPVEHLNVAVQFLSRPEFHRRVR